MPWPQPNPVGVGLAGIGALGLAMGARISKGLGNWAPAPDGDPAPEPVRTRPELGDAITRRRAEVDLEYPGFKECFRRGEEFGFSVTGQADGFALHWQVVDYPLTDQAFLFFDYKRPSTGAPGAQDSGSGLGMVFDSRDAAFAALEEVQREGWEAYHWRQKAVGSPYIGSKTWSSVNAC